MNTPSEFHLFDNAAARAEGWQMGDRSGDKIPFAIETLDDPEVFGVQFSFDSDQDAYVHVVARAMAGSRFHQQALDFLERNSPEAYDWAIETYIQSVR